MNKRENLLSLLRRQGYEYVPIEFDLCPSLNEVYKERIGSDMWYGDYFGFPCTNINDLSFHSDEPDRFQKYYPEGLKPGTWTDMWGVAYEPGSEAARHMTHMLHPLKDVEDIEQLMAYPFPKPRSTVEEYQKKKVDEAREKGLASVGSMQCTIWETAWYMRSMEQLMMDMVTEDRKAEYLLDKVTEISCIRAAAFAHAGADILFLGDDIGMQRTTLMSESMYCTWLKPRLKKVISAAKAVKPDIIVFYHSCGFAAPFIPHLIDAGIDVLNPVQPECMDFKTIHEMYGDKLSFHGTIGTQTTMPYGTPEDVRREVFRNLEIAGDKGGLFVAPTHVLEPEVPWENIIAYVEACRDFK